MDDVAVELIKKIGTEKRLPHKIFFDWHSFKKIIGMWILGGVLAFLPIAVGFFMKPIENLTIVEFFNNLEIIYVCVTMAIIALSEIARKNIGALFWVIMLLVFFGVLSYGMLKGGAIIPILDHGDNLSVFTICFFLLVFFFGLLGYIIISFKRRGAG